MKSKVILRIVKMKWMMIQNLLSQTRDILLLRLAIKRRARATFQHQIRLIRLSLTDS